MSGLAHTFPRREQWDLDDYPNASFGDKRPRPLQEDEAPMDILTRDTADKAKGDGYNRERHDPIDVFGEEYLAAAVLGLVHLADDIPSQV